MTPVLRLQHKTLARAFTNKNAGNLNEFFSIQFLDLLVNIQRLGSVSPARPLLDVSRLLAQHSAKFDQSLPAAHWLHLPEDVKFQVTFSLRAFSLIQSMLCPRLTTPSASLRLLTSRTTARSSMTCPGSSISSAVVCFTR